MNKIVSACMAAALVFCFNGASGSIKEQPPDPKSDYSGGTLLAKYEAGLLSVDIKDADLEDVLQKLSEQTGIIFSMPPSLGKEKVMVRFAKFTIDEGLNKILAPYDRIFIYDGAHGKPEEITTNRLKEVRLYLYQENKKGESEPHKIISPKTTTQNVADAAQDAQEQDRYVVKNTTKGIGKSIEDLSKAMQNQDPNVRLNAVLGLAKMGVADVFQPLHSALMDTNPEVRQEAEKALSQLQKDVGDEFQPNNDVNEEPPPPVEGTPSFGIESSGPIGQGSGSQVEVDIRLTDVPEKIITGGFMINYNPSEMKILGADVYDGSALSGPWDSEMTNKVENPKGPGTYMVVVGNLSSVAPDNNSDINIAKLRFNCTGSCDGPITITPVPGFDTVVGNSSGVYDSKMSPSQFTIR